MGKIDYGMWGCILGIQITDAFHIWFDEPRWPIQGFFILTLSVGIVSALIEHRKE